MNKSKIVFILILVLLAGNLFLSIKYFSAVKELRQTQTALETLKTNDKILEFTKLFIEKVLKTETEVDFEMRLILENAVRNLGDGEIVSQWQKFTESKTEDEAQENVKNLLETLVNNIEVR